MTITRISTAGLVAKYDADHFHGLAVRLKDGLDSEETICEEGFALLVKHAMLFWNIIDERNLPPGIVELDSPLRWTRGTDIPTSQDERRKFIVWMVSALLDKEAELRNELV